MTFKRLLFNLYKSFGKAYLAPLLNLEFKQGRKANFNERSIEYGFSFRKLMELTPRTVLDVGSGTTAWPHLLANSGFVVTAIDQIDDYWQNRHFNRHFKIQKDDITKPVIEEQFDFITCLSVLEHIPDHRAAMANMFKLLKPGGHLLLTFPYSERTYVENVYKHPNAGYGQKNPYICRVYSRAEVDEWQAQAGAEIVDQEFHQVFDGELWTMGQRIKPPRKTGPNEPHHLLCLLMRKPELSK